MKKCPMFPFKTLKNLVEVVDSTEWFGVGKLGISSLQWCAKSWPVLGCSKIIRCSVLQVLIKSEFLAEVNVIIVQVHGINTIDRKFLIVLSVKANNAHAAEMYHSVFKPNTFLWLFFQVFLLRDWH